jgi:hypothetical protein
MGSAVCSFLEDAALLRLWEISLDATNIYDEVRSHDLPVEHPIGVSFSIPIQDIYLEIVKQ